MQITVKTTMTKSKIVDVRFPVYSRTDWGEEDHRWTIKTADGKMVSVILKDDSFEVEEEHHRVLDHMFSELDSEEYNLGLGYYGCTEKEFKGILAQAYYRLERAAGVAGMTREELQALADKVNLHETVGEVATVRIYKCEKCGVEGPDVTLHTKYAYRLCPKCGTDVFNEQAGKAVL